MSSYRAPMRSRLPSVDPAPAVERALALEVVGIGGRLSRTPQDLSAAVELTAQEHDERTARRLERFASVVEGAEMWTREPGGPFRRGTVTGAWRYDASPEAHLADLVHVRPCPWDPEPLGHHEVPAAVAASFRRGGRNFQRIREL